jgi:leucine dehydrogenase
VQGLGNVGFRLARLLKQSGASLRVCDVSSAAVERAVAELGAEAVGVADIYDQEVDVLAPSALGAILNDATLGAPAAARSSAGGANNQLAEERHAQRARRTAGDPVLRRTSW